MQQDFRIVVLDRANIGPDLDYQPISLCGPLSLRDQCSQSEIVPTIIASRARIVVANRPLFDRAILQAAADAGLELICLTATGTNSVDLEAARDFNIAVCNIVGYSTESVAQHSFALALGLINQTSYFHKLARTWPTRAGTDMVDPPTWTVLDRDIHELDGLTWGIIGLGAIGRRVASLASAFGCRVVWASASHNQRVENWPQLEIPELLATSDIISIHSPITETSRNLIRRQELETMKPNAILINVGRGGIINEVDLADALRKGEIAGAGIDVLWPEPPAADNPLFSLPDDGRLILSPHIAWAAVEARQRALAECAANIESWLNGARRNRVD